MKNRRLWVSILAGFLAAVMLLGLIASIIPTPASAASSSEIQKQIDSMKEEKKQMQEQLQELKNQQSDNLSDIKNLMSQKSVLEQQVGILHQQIDNTTQQIAAYSLLIADKQIQLDEAEERLAALTEQNLERIRAMEENGTISYWSVLFNSGSFMDFLDRLNMIQEIEAADKRRLEEMRQMAQQVAEAKNTLIAEKAELELVREELSAEQVELVDKEQEAMQALNQLLSRGEEFEKMMDEQEQLLTQFEKDLAQKKQEYEDKKEEEYWEAYWATYVPPTTKPPASNYGGSGGSLVDKGSVTWMVPCNYIRVSSPFGWRLHPVYGDYRFHAGVDLATPCPNEIYATRAGVVTVATYSNSAGYYVEIDHKDGFKSVYMHMCKMPNVREGDVVQQGQVIGCIGTTGASTGNHLHFGISFNGENVNPMDYIG